MSVTIVATPELRSSNAKTAAYLTEKTELDGLFLQFPQESQDCIRQFSEGFTPEYLFYEVLKCLNSIIQPIGPWADATEPLLKALPQIKEINQKLEIYCYGDVFDQRVLSQFLEEIALLTLRGSISKNIDVEEWKQVFQKCQQSRQMTVHKEADFIIVNAGKHEESICVSSDEEYLVSQLAQEGYKTRLIPLDRSPSTPIETLANELGQGNIPTDERIKQLALLHIEYVNSFVVFSKNLTEARYRWQSERTDKETVI